MESILQPSVVDLARSGNFRAIAYWMNTFLLPQGMRASVEDVRAGCLQILVEFRQIPERDRLVQFICHQIWRLNSEAIDGVRIVARLAGQSDILWKQSVRIVTPANRRRQEYGPYPARARAERSTEGISFKALRALLMVGTAVTSFVVGCWFSYQTILTSRIAPNPLPTAAVTAIQTPARPKQVQAALEMVPVRYHDRVVNPNDPVVTLMFGGDVTLSDAFADVVGSDYKWAFAEMDEYRQADVAMVNLENPLTRADTLREGKQFNFKADPESVQVLTEGGIDIVNLANNHAMDYEAPGLKETTATLEKAGIRYVGAGQDIKEARRPEIIEVKGQRIAYLGYYNPEFHAAAPGVAGTNPLIEAQIAEDIKAIRDQVDWIVVNYHWGEELAEYPADWQRDLARFTIDQGADVVVGHHPHVLQGAEIYKGRPIAYSLGNFIFGGNYRSDYDTAVLKVSLKGKKMKVEFLPVEVRKYQPKVISGDRASEILNYIQEISHIFDRPMRSPTVLTARRRSDRATETPLPQPALPNLPKPSASPVAPSNSAIVTPVFPGDIIRRNYLNDGVLPGLQPTEGTMPPSESKGSDDDPFSKQPFINAPDNTKPVLTPHSFLPARPSVSFNVSARVSACQHADKIAQLVGRQNRDKAIQLPVIA